jgi:hypothetical protein
MNRTTATAAARVTACVLAACLALYQGAACATGAPPELRGKPLPIYESKPNDCYVLLRPQFPSILSGDYPVCWAVLDVLNKSCAEPPQYDHRKFNLSKRLSEPKWQPLDASRSLDLIPWILSPYGSPENRDAYWVKERERMTSLAASGTLRLFQADVVGVDLRGGTNTVYRLENAFPTAPPGFNQARIMFAEQGDRVPGARFEEFRLSVAFASDLVSFREHWFLFEFNPRDHRFLVNELSRPAGDHVGTVTRCSIQFEADHEQGK